MPAFLHELYRSRRTTLQSAPPGIQSLSRICQFRGTPAMFRSGPALPLTRARREPCRRWRERPIRMPYPREPKLGLGAKRGVRFADQECGRLSLPPLNRSMTRASEKTVSLRCLHPGHRTSREHWRAVPCKNAAAACDQQKRGAIPLTEQFGHAVESEPFADGAEVEFKPAL